MSYTPSIIRVSCLTRTPRLEFNTLGVGQRKSFQNFNRIQPKAEQNPNRHTSAQLQFFIKPFKKPQLIFFSNTVFFEEKRDHEQFKQAKLNQTKFQEITYKGKLRVFFLEDEIHFPSTHTVNEESNIKELPDHP